MPNVTATMMSAASATRTYRTSVGMGSACARRSGWERAERPCTRAGRPCRWHFWGPKAYLSLALAQHDPEDLLHDQVDRHARVDLEASALVRPTSRSVINAAVAVSSTM